MKSSLSLNELIMLDTSLLIMIPFYNYARFTADSNPCMSIFI